ncbi:MAG: LacI family DNA-binding transcriptional regulator [Anaerolineae bacterium]|nr:LacI family DNA-binding transcriptional regulator [Anaerolineae bacterium]
MTTVKDVAVLAGVSTATVSRVLNGHPNVSPETRARVARAVEQLGYRPNRVARNLRVQTSQTIAVIIPDIQNNFFVSVVRGIEDVAIVRDHILLLGNTDDSLSREARYIDVLLAEGVAGIIICASDGERSCVAVRRAVEQGVPVVALDRQLHGLDVDTVLTDNVGASRTATDYLIANGHIRIGLIAGPDYLTPGRERREGYEQALAAHGLPVDPALVKVTDFRPSQAREAARTLLDAPEPPTAMLVCSGLMAVEAMRELAARHLDPQQDIALVAFDDTVLNRCLCPPIPLITQSTYELGQAAAQLLFARMHDPQQPTRTLRLPTSLLLPESVSAVGHTPAAGR